MTLILMSLSDSFFCFSASLRLRLSSSRRFLFSSSLCRFFSSSLLLLSSLFSSLILCEQRRGRYKRLFTLYHTLWTEGISFHYLTFFLFLTCFSIFLFLMYSNKGVVRLAETKQTEKEVREANKDKDIEAYFSDSQVMKSSLVPYLSALWSWPLSPQATSQDWPSTSPHHRSNSPKIVYIRDLRAFQGQDKHTSVMQ